MSPPPSQSASAPLSPFAEFLTSRREAILAEWRNRAAADDLEASAAVTLMRVDFYDHIPQFLGRLSEILSGRGGDFTEDSARKHGAHRWQQGSNLAEVAGEWGHLHRVVVQEFTACAAAQPALSTALLLQANEVVSQQIYHAVAISLEEFHDRQRLEADARRRDLEDACRHYEESEILRGQNLRESSHDLKGGLHLIRMAADLLLTKDFDKETRFLVETIVSASKTQNQLLIDLLDLARLEAGREEIEIAEFDAAALLGELVERMQPTAETEHLALRASGPTPFMVQGDAVKVQRIGQNLVLNALKYTQQGEVEVTWRAGENQRWSLTVRDTGPGLAQTTAGSLRDGLEAASESSQDSVEHQARISDSAGSNGNAANDHHAAATARHGEGIGLSIVKRLCELLDGMIEVDSVSGQGTIFRIILPQRYAKE